MIINNPQGLNPSEIEKMLDEAVLDETELDKTGKKRMSIISQYGIEPDYDYLNQFEGHFISFRDEENSSHQEK
jgi:hypothetical protein